MIAAATSVHNSTGSHLRRELGACGAGNGAGASVVIDGVVAVTAKGSGARVRLRLGQTPVVCVGW